MSDQQDIPKKKKLPLALTISLSTIVVLLVLVTGTLVYLNFPVGETGETAFKIEQGESLSATSKKLEEQGFTRSALFFRLLFQATGRDTTFPSGTFLLPRGKSAWELREFFRTARPIHVKVTIPEGWTARKISELLEEKGIVSQKEFMAALTDPNVAKKWPIAKGNLDGFLYPDTYFFPLSATAQEVIERLVSTFFEKTADLEKGQTSEEFYQGLVLASIVEREYRVDLEAPTIASVFVNRLKSKYPLASCATIEYILTEIQGRPHPKRIFFVHTQIPSPYNTYLNRGLPPGPICNPGLVALRAAFHPATTNYFYFVINNAEKGTHSFSSTYGAHEKAREEYLNTYTSKS